VFAHALQVAKEQARPTPRKRRQAPGGDRKPSLRSVEGKLLFASLYTFSHGDCLWAAQRTLDPSRPTTQKLKPLFSRKSIK
jgi:hypothetical protein